MWQHPTVSSNCWALFSLCLCRQTLELGYEGPWPPNALIVCSLDVSISVLLVRWPSFIASVDHWVCGYYAFSHILCLFHCPCPYADIILPIVHAQPGPCPDSDLLVSFHDLWPCLAMVRQSLLVWLHLPLHFHLQCLFPSPTLWDFRSCHDISNICAFSAGPFPGMSASYSSSRKRMVHIDY